MHQRTLKECINLVGRESYGGCEVKVSIAPAETNTGIIFKLLQGDIPANIDYVYPARFSTVLRRDNVGLLCSEHILATLYAYGIDNAEISLNKIQSKSLKLLRRLDLDDKTEAVPYFPNLERDLCEKIEKVGYETQEKPRKTLRLKNNIYTDKLNFEIIDSDDLIITAITNYTPIGQQEKTIIINPESYKKISTARAYCKFIPDWVPEELCRRVLGALTSPRSGLYSYVSDNTAFRKAGSAEKWKARERMDSEIACHTIIDKLGTLSLLPGKLSGVHLTCKFSGHKNDIEILKKYKDEFYFDEG